MSLLAWALLRVHARAGFRGPWRMTALDALPVGVGFVLGVLGEGRPLLTGAAVLGAAGGLILADRVKRATLDEPLVFADRAELTEVFRHPSLYIPHAGTGTVLAAAASLLAVAAVLLAVEPDLFDRAAAAQILSAASAVGAGRACFLLPGRRPLRGSLARAAAALAPSGDPETDIRRFGLLGCFIVQATTARAERPGRRLAAALAPRPRLAPAGPLVIVQSESFADLARLDEDLGAALQPAYGRARREAACQGRLSVPAWGANTVRTEFAALTGLAETALGLDRFNPYDQFARAGVPSLVHDARRAGFRTVCVHPFDLSFYGRRHVLPLLGFDRLVGPEAFRRSPRGGSWVADAAVADKVVELLAEEGPQVLIFAITMECHAPWTAHEEAAPAGALVGIGPQSRPYMARLRSADALVTRLTAALADTAGPAWLAFYGDHLPTPPKDMPHAAAQDRRADYLIWSNRGGAGQQLDLAAHDLWATLAEVVAAA